MLPLILALLAATPAGARDGDSGGEATLAREIGNRIARPPVDCIDLSATSSPTVVEGTAIVYRDGGRLYVNRPLGNTAALHRDDTLVTSIHGGQLCRLDSVTLLEPVTHARYGFVVLGPFVPYDPPPR